MKTLLKHFSLKNLSTTLPAVASLLLFLIVFSILPYNLFLKITQPERVAETFFQQPTTPAPRPTEPWRSGATPVKIRACPRPLIPAQLEISLVNAGQTFEIKKGEIIRLTLEEEKNKQSSVKTDPTYFYTICQDVLVNEATIRSIFYQARATGTTTISANSLTFTFKID